MTPAAAYRGKHRTGYLFQRGAKGTFYLQYRVDGRTVIQSLNTADPKMAEAERQRIMQPLMLADRASAHAIVEARLREVKAEAEAAAEAAAPTLAVADAWKAYEKTRNRPDSSERTLAGYESAWRRFEKWMSTEHPDMVAMRDVQPTTAAAYADQLTADKVSASTFNQHIGLLRLVWRCLAVPIRGAGNPWMEIAKRRPQRLAHRRRAITPEQFNALLAAAPDADYHDLLFTLGMTGQRLVDGIMLRWDAIDFKRRVITLYPRKTARTGKAVMIPLLPALNDLLNKRRDMVSGPLVFPALVKDYDRDSGGVSKRIQSTFERAGLTPRENMPGVGRAVVLYGAHSLRHYFVTQAMAAGIPAEIVKRITGHSSDAMLEGYEHIDAALIGGLAKKLSATPTLPAAAPVAALPAAPEAPITRAQVRALADRLNSKTWKAVRAEMLTLAATEAGS